MENCRHRPEEFGEVVYLILVPGHAGVEGNELADQAAKEGGLRDQNK